jgi:pimeloyl-ACP methyl ester carboxylesterase
VSISRVWGSFDAYPARYGVARYRLVVFPPGITARERRILRMWRSWPLWGAALWVGLQIGGELAGMPETALIGGSMIYIAVGALVFVLAGDTRVRVRTLCAVNIAGYGQDDVDRRYSVLRVMARTLDHADLDLEEGRISPPEHEARWWQVYDVLDAMASSAPSSRTSHTPSAISAAASNPAIPRSTKPSGINVHHR